MPNKIDSLTLPNSSGTNITYDIDEPTDIIINGLGFIRITKAGSIRVHALDLKLIGKRMNNLYFRKTQMKDSYIGRRK